MLRYFFLVVDLVSLILFTVLIRRGSYSSYYSSSYYSSSSYSSYSSVQAAFIQVVAWISLKSMYFLYNQKRSGLASRNPQAFKASSGLFMLGVMVNVIALIVLRWPLASPLFLFPVTQIDWTVKGPYSWKYFALLFTVLSIVSDSYVCDWITNQDYWRWKDAFTLTQVNLYVISLIMIFVSWEAFNIISDKPHAAWRKYMGTDRSIKSPLLIIYYLVTVIMNVVIMNVAGLFVVQGPWPSGLSSIFLGLILPKDLSFHSISLKRLTLILGALDLLLWILSFYVLPYLLLFVEIESLIVFAVYIRLFSKTEKWSSLLYFKLIVSLTGIAFSIIDISKTTDWFDRWMLIFSSLLDTCLSFIATCVILWLHEKDVRHEMAHGTEPVQRSNCVNDNPRAASNLARNSSMEIPLTTQSASRSASNQALNVSVVEEGLPPYSREPKSDELQIP